MKDRKKGRWGKGNWWVCYHLINVIEAFTLAMTILPSESLNRTNRSHPVTSQHHHSGQRMLSYSWGCFVVVINSQRRSDLRQPWKSSPVDKTHFSTLFCKRSQVGSTLLRLIFFNLIFLLAYQERPMKEKLLVRLESLAMLETSYSSWGAAITWTRIYPKKVGLS